MVITAIQGVVENGKIRLEEKVSLPENTKVFVIVADAIASPAREVIHLRSPRLANPQDLGDFHKEILDA